MLIFSIACLIIGSDPTAFAGTTVDRVKAAASLPCGVNTEEPEYSTQDAHGNHSVFDVNICKAVASRCSEPTPSSPSWPFATSRTR